LYTADRCARLILTKFFNVQEDTISSEEMAVQVGKIVLRAKWQNLHTCEERKKNDECIEYAVSAVDASPQDAMRHLKQVLGGLTEEQKAKLLEGMGVNVSVERIWLVDLIVLADMLLFYLVNALLLLVGISGAVVKVSAGAVVLTDVEATPIWIYFWIAAFCNQLIGIFTIEELLIGRVQTFVFGGTDACVQMEEHFLIDLYMGHLMQRIWQSDCQNLSVWNKLALLFKLDDDDLQQLIVEEDYGQKSQVTLSVHHHLRVHNLQGVGIRVRERLGRWASKLE